MPRDRFDHDQPIKDLCAPLSARVQPRECHISPGIQMQAQAPGATSEQQGDHSGPTLPAQNDGLFRRGGGRRG